MSILPPLSSEEEGALAAEFDLSFSEPPTEASEAEAERECNRLLAALGSIRDNKAANARLRDEEVQRLDQWLARVNAPLERQEAYLLGMLRHLSGFVRYYGKAKSRDLPHGRVGWRTKPERIVIEDPDTLVQWAKAHGLGHLLKTEESLPHAVVEKEWKQARRVIADYVPPGCKVVEAEETFFAEAEGVVA